MGKYTPRVASFYPFYYSPKFCFSTTTQDLIPEKELNWFNNGGDNEFSYLEAGSVVALYCAPVAPVTLTSQYITDAVVYEKINSSNPKAAEILLGGFEVEIEETGNMTDSGWRRKSDCLSLRDHTCWEVDTEIKLRAASFHTGNRTKSEQKSYVFDLFP